MHNQKMMVIGLDGATFDLMKPWIKDGKLPNLAKIMRNGSHGDLQSVTPPESPLAWPSFATGKNPGKHGIFGFYEPHPDKAYALSPINARSNRAKTLYKILADAGKKVTTLAVPFTFPPEQIKDGIVIPGEFSLPGEAGNVATSHPPEIHREISAQIKDTRLGVDTSLAYESPPAFIQDLYATTDNLMEMADYLLNHKPWDFFMLVFSGVDQVEHYFFRNHINKDHLHDTMLQYYEKVDQAVAQILQTIDDDVTLFVMSDHGMQHFSQYFCLNLWLHEKGLLVFKNPAQKWVKRQMINALNKSGVKTKLLEILDLSRFSKGAISNALSFDDVDFTKTKAYAYGFGSIRLNLKGRDPSGIVDQNEYEVLRDQLIADLKAEKDLTNTPVLTEVLRREEVYSGPFLEQAPDVVVTSDQFWPNGLAGVGPFSNLYAAKIENSPFINGMHAMSGIFMAKGPHIQSDLQIDDAALIDLAPSVLYAMGLPIPDDMDGKVLECIFDPQFIQAQPPRFIEVSSEEGSNEERYVWSPEEEELLLSRLQDLGYLG